MSAVNTWITEYGYAAVMGGTVLEGESVAIVAGIAARHGLMNVGLVILLAALGGMIGDLIMFSIGRRYGDAALNRFGAKRRAALARAQALVARHPAKAVVGVRFAYGLRLVGPVVIGASGVPWPRFLVFNAIGALVWATIMVGIGYGAGEILHRFVAHHHHHLGVWLAIGVTGAVIAFIASHRWLRRARSGEV